MWPGYILFSILVVYDKKWLRHILCLILIVYDRMNVTGTHFILAFSFIHKKWMFSSLIESRKNVSYMFCFQPFLSSISALPILNFSPSYPQFPSQNKTILNLQNKYAKHCGTNIEAAYLGLPIFCNCATNSFSSHLFQNKIFILAVISIHWHP